MATKPLSIVYKFRLNMNIPRPSATPQAGGPATAAAAFAGEEPAAPLLAPVVEADTAPVLVAPDDAPVVGELLSLHR
jgi:hypothetical protein